MDIASLADAGLFDDAEDDDAPLDLPVTAGASAGVAGGTAATATTAKEYRNQSLDYYDYPSSDEEDEDVEDVLMDTDWNLGNATHRFKTIAGGAGQMNSNAVRKAMHSQAMYAKGDTGEYQPMEKTKLFQRIKVDR